MTDYRYIRELPAYAELTPCGVELVERILDGVPARSVGERSLFSVSGALANPKFRHHKEFESAGCEKAFVLVSIMDERVVDIFPQPVELNVIKHDKNGRRRHGRCVPDYLCCTKDHFYFVECKHLNDLFKLADASSDWSRCHDGTWQFLPGTEAASSLGMGYRVFFPESFPSVYLTNLQIITRLTDENLLEANPGTLDRLRTSLTSRPHTLGELCAKYDGVTGAFVYQAILCNEVSGMLNLQHFDKDFLLFATAEEAQTIESDIRRMALQPEHQFGPMHLRLLKCSPLERKLAIEASVRYFDRRKKGIPKNATDYRDDARRRLAEKEGAPEIAAFVRRVGDRGGSGNALPDEVQDSVIAHLKAFIEDGNVPKLSKARADYQIHAEEAGAYLPSPEAYRRIVRRSLAPERLAFMAGGKRAFHAARPMVDGRDANPRIDISGLRAHIDGVYGDAVTRPDTEAMYLRPIFYPLITETGFVLGLGVKVGKPSSLAVLMAFRDCFTLHGYIPHENFYDWGPENEALAVKDALAFFSAGYERRPVGAPRFGGIVESFNANFSAFLQSLPGGMYFDKAGRRADGNKKGRSTASLDIPDYIRSARRFAMDVWNKQPIGGRGATPEQLHCESLKIFPEAVKHVADDPMARYHTSYPLKGADFDYVRGFRFGGERFHSQELVAALQSGERPAGPRLDCTDPSIVHALTGDGPIALYSLQTERVGGLDFAQRMVEQQALLTYSTNAKKNQHARSVKEARLLRDAKKVSDALNSKSAPTQAADEDEHDVYQPDFSNVMDDEPMELERLE